MLSYVAYYWNIVRYILESSLDAGIPSFNQVKIIEILSIPIIMICCSITVKFTYDYREVALFVLLVQLHKTIIRF